MKDKEEKTGKVIHAEMHTRLKVPKPERYKRDRYGLITNVKYVFNDDGSVNWRAMVNPDHLYPNSEYFTARGEEIPDSIEGLEDNQLLIKLAGIKELARLRGFQSVDYEVIESSATRAVVICTITFVENYETDGKMVYFSSVANATTDNTVGFSTKFLESIAENRAFVRCVRNFLNIHVVGEEEIDEAPFKKPSAEAKREESGPMPSPEGVLKDVLAKYHNVYTWDEFKTMLRRLWTSEKYRNEEAGDWKSYSDIPTSEKRKLISLLKSLETYD